MRDALIDALLFVAKVLLGALLTYVLMVISVRIVGYHLQKAAVEKRIRAFKSG